MLQHPLSRQSVYSLIHQTSFNLLIVNVGASNAVVTSTVTVCTSYFDLHYLPYNTCTRCMHNSCCKCTRPVIVIPASPINVK